MGPRGSKRPGVQGFQAGPGGSDNKRAFEMDPVYGDGKRDLKVILSSLTFGHNDAGI